MKRSNAPSSSSRPRSQSPRRGRETNRSFRGESLELRTLLAGDTLAWHNAAAPCDANADGLVNSLDALAIIRDLNHAGARDVDASQAFGLKLDVNADGVVSARDALQVLDTLDQPEGEGELLQVRLVVTGPDSLDPIDSLSINEPFVLRAYVTDLSDPALGVFAAYLDVTYDQDLADVTGDIERGPTFPNGRSGDVSLDGLINEIGSFAGFDPPGPGEFLLFSLPMTTQGTVGTLSFAGDPADVLPAHDVLLFGANDPIPGSEILFLGTEVQITGGGGPVAIPESYTMFEDDVLNVAGANGLLANDVDGNAAPLTAVLFSSTSNGTLSLNADGSFQYTPNANFNGTDSFSYAANNGVISSNPVTVTIDIAPVNDAPVAVGETYSTPMNVTLTVFEGGLLLNDTDVEGSSLSVVLVREIQNGNLTIQPNGLFAYIPGTDFVGTVSFDYVVQDGELTSNVATATVNVVSDVPLLPRAVADTFALDENSTLTVDAALGLLVNDVNPTGAQLSAQIVTNPTNGTLVLLPDGSFSYVPNSDFVGVDSFTYAIRFGQSTSEPANVTLTVNAIATGNAPNATGNQYSGFEDVTLRIAAPGVLEGDTDADGDLLTAVAVTQPTHGVLALRADGSFDYTPNPDFFGVDSFTYVANDGALNSQPATVTLDIASQMDPPISQGESYTTEFETTLVVSAAQGILANDTDVDGDSLTALVLTPPNNGTLEIDDDGGFVYTPDTGFFGTDSFTYTVLDGFLAAQPATTTIVVNPLMTADALVAIRLVVTDLSGSPITSIDAGEEFLLQMRVEDLSDDARGVFAAYADVTWNATLAFVSGAVVHDAHYANGATAGVNTPGLLNEAGGFDGFDELGGGELVLLTVPMQATGVGTITFAADPADLLPAGDVLLFGIGEAISQARVTYGTATLTVNASAQPVAANDTYAAPGGVISVPATQGVLANDIAATTALTASLVQTTRNGVLNLNADGSFTYTANAGFLGTDSFTYRALAGGVQSELATVTIQVTNPPRSSIAGSVYFDTNNNGMFDDGEHPFGGVTVRLVGTDIVGNSVSRTATTNREGSYQFVNLLGGEYTVLQDQPGLVIDGIDSNGLTHSENDQFAITLTDQDLAGYNFGERGLLPEFVRKASFFASAPISTASVGIGADGEQWYCLDSGWENFQSVRAEVVGSTVSILAVDLNGIPFAASTTNVNLRGSALQGYHVQFLSPASSYGLQPVVSAAAVDALFAAE